MDKIKILRVIGFVIFFLTIFVYLQTVFSSRYELTKETMDVFYRERKNSVDVVYLGASPVHRYWDSEVAYHQNGIVVLNYSYCSQPSNILTDLIKEIYKYQKPQLLIIDIRPFSFQYNVDLGLLHPVLNYMPLSKNKIKLTSKICKINNIENCLEFYFPIIRFHERWKYLNRNDFFYVDNKRKTYKLHKYYKIMQTSNMNPYMTRDIEPVDHYNQHIFLDLLLYLKINNINTLFVSSPFLDQERYKKINWLLKTANLFGFKTLNFNETNLYSATGIKYPVDWADSGHVNVKGAIKYTNYFSKILKEEYNLPDRRNQKGYESWDRAWEEYKKELQKYDIDVEEVLNE